MRRFVESFVVRTGVILLSLAAVSSAEGSSHWPRSISGPSGFEDLGRAIRKDPGFPTKGSEVEKARFIFSRLPEIAKKYGLDAGSGGVMSNAVIGASRLKSDPENADSLKGCTGWGNCGEWSYAFQQILAGTGVTSEVVYGDKEGGKGRSLAFNGTDTTVFVRERTPGGAESRRVFDPFRAAYHGSNWQPTAASVTDWSDRPLTDNDKLPRDASRYSWQKDPLIDKPYIKSAISETELPPQEPISVQEQKVRVRREQARKEWERTSAEKDRKALNKKDREQYEKDEEIRKGFAARDRLVEKVRQSKEKDPAKKSWEPMTPQERRDALITSDPEAWKKVKEALSGDQKSADEVIEAIDSRKTDVIEDVYDPHRDPRVESKGTGGSPIDIAQADRLSKEFQEIQGDGNKSDAKQGPQHTVRQPASYTEDSGKKPDTSGGTQQPPFSPYPPDYPPEGGQSGVRTPWEGLAPPSSGHGGKTPGKTRGPRVPTSPHPTGDSSSSGTSSSPPRSGSGEKVEQPCSQCQAWAIGIECGRAKRRDPSIQCIMNQQQVGNCYYRAWEEGLRKGMGLTNTPKPGGC